MSLLSLPGPYAYIGPSPYLNPSNGLNAFPLSAVNSSLIVIGRMMTSDQGSHTINTSAPSSIGWRSDSITFANAATSVSVGIAAVDTGNGPPGRAVNSAGVITFDVAAVFAGAGGGITDSAWQTSVPTTGSKAIGHGDLVAIAIQMTARGGSDVIRIDMPNPSTGLSMRPAMTTFNGSSYSGQSIYLPDFFVTFADGAFGWIEGSDIASAISARSWNSGSATKEYGQLYQMPFPMNVCGLYCWGSLSNDVTLNLYSDPLGTPVAQKSALIVQKTITNNSAGFFCELFSSPFSVSANQPIGAVLTPGAGTVNHYYKTLANANHRVADPWGTSGYGISRASGAFANANSSLDHYYIGLLVSAFDGGGAGGGLLVNPGMRGGML